MADRGRGVPGAARGAGTLSTLAARLRDGRVLLVGGALVLAVLLLVVGALLGGWRPFSNDPSVLSFGPGGDMSRFALFDGQCASGELGGSSGFGPENDAPCGELHDVEVVGSRAPLDEGREVTYPGEDAMGDFGRAYCAIVLDSAIVADEADGVSKDALEVTAVIPTRAAFDSPRTADASSSGARQVSCVIGRSDGDQLSDRFSVI